MKAFAGNEKLPWRWISTKAAAYLSRFSRTPWRDGPKCWVIRQMNRCAGFLPVCRARPMLGLPVPDLRPTPDIDVVFGGDEKPLWRQFVDAWPQGEPVLNWHICSPSWPQVDQSAARNPFEAIANALKDRGCSLADCDLEIIACADSPGPNALPRFPFSLLSYLREQDFPIQRGRILPAKLEAANDEIPAGMAGENRELHAKWIILAGANHGDCPGGIGELHPARAGGLAESRRRQYRGWRHDSMATGQMAPQGVAASDSGAGNRLGNLQRRLSKGSW